MSTAATILVLVGFGVFAGHAAGLLGVGGGVLIVPFLVMGFGISQHAANATSLLVVLPTAVIASIALHRRGIGDLPTALKLGAVGAVASGAGAALALELSAPTLRIFFAMLLGLVACRMIVDALRQSGEPA
jgi:uncharacterized membrane protein YfcA